ncbi:MAG: amidohydrolase [Acidimicrobiales bacterium]|nr:amidohydrolase [Acidimicrobiales bacterium]
MPDPVLLEEAGAVMEQAVDVRRRLHSHPEIGLELPDTQQLVVGQLRDLGLEGHEGVSCCSVVAVIEGNDEGPTTLLRADMDALEMPEDTGVDFGSEIRGRMHACGHDAHVAMLLGAARVLKSRRRDLKGRVVLMFQPGEEGHDGAKHMLDEGLLDTYGPIQRAFALHVSSMIPSGLITTRAGTIMASADEFAITVTGRGGHASMPHDALDPIPAACQIVTSIQSMVTRMVPVFDPAVVTVSTFHAGTAQNVIPERVVMTGTIRAVSDASRDIVLSRLGELAQDTAAAHGCAATVDMMPCNYPVTVNDADFAEHTLAVANDLVGPEKVSRLPSPVMGAEDWSHVLQAVPGSIAFLGAAPPGVDRPAPNHSNRFMIDEDAMATGIAIYAAIALSPQS